MARIGTDIEEAIRRLQRGELVAIPTETVYGLAANGLDAAAVLDIFKVKNRPTFDPLILHVADMAAASAVVTEMRPAARALAEAFWPGPLTLLLERGAQVPDLVTAGLPRVALRIPDHPLTRLVLERLDFPLAAPSANPFGYVSPTTARHVADQLGERVPYILDGGPCRVGLESTIVGFEGEEPVIYRLGGISQEAIEALIGPVRRFLNQSSNPRAPGMIKSHYAPRKKVYVGDIEALLAAQKHRRVGVLAFRQGPSLPAARQVIVLSPRGSLDEAARGLFGALRELDASEVDLILAERFPDEGLGRAINDRLRRAATA